MWRYQIFFDEKLKDEITYFITNYRQSEKKIMTDLMDYYLSFYSFQLLIDALTEQDPTEHNTIIAKAKKHINQILNVPPSLYDYYVEKIKIFSSYEVDLLSILNEAVKQPHKEINQKLYQIIFGNYLPNLKTYIEAIASQPIPAHTKKALEITDVSKTFENLIELVSTNKDLIQKFGPMSNKNYDIIVKDDHGFGEWWDKDLYDDYSENTLILYKNAEAMNYDDFLYTILHEVYPGHGYFFDRIKLNKENVIDSGAMFLIEGYATFVELTANLNDYSNHLRQRYAHIAAQMLSSTYLNQSTPNSLIYYTQYIGYLESYYLGAFMIEYLLHEKNYNSIDDFISHITKSQIGDFYTLW